MTGSAPRDGDWRAVTNRVTGIYGANASGKSTVLDALDFLREALSISATRWGERKTFPHYPFALNSDSIQQPSLYEVDFVVDRIRYTYGFESEPAGVVREWLYSYPARRRRVLFDRDGRSGETFFGRQLPGENNTISKLVRPTALFLSVAANSNHETLTPIHVAIVNGIRYSRLRDFDRQLRLRWIRDVLEDESLHRQAENLVRFADLGISRVRLDEGNLTAEDRKFVENLYGRLAKSLPLETRPIFSLDDLIQDFRKSIRFVHHAENGADEQALSLEDESSGTVAWLGLAVPALHSLRRGETLIIDEIDSSLHPRLTAALIHIFKDADINQAGAQLIFTSHNTALMGRLLGDVLERDEIWFTEKNSVGETSLYALEEFSARHSDNFEKRYLEGRYGALPIVHSDELKAALTVSGF